MRNLFGLLALLLMTINSAYAMNLVGRLGIGYSNQVVTGIDTLSLKLQRNRANAFGALLGVDSSSDASNYALGLKVYRVIYDEPQLNFYSAFSGIFFTYQDPEDTDQTENGHQLDASFGTEFSFAGLESIGFSFEFGLGMNKYNGSTNIGTVGYGVLTSAVHFYL
jgi:hypothetical protein